MQKIKKIFTVVLSVFAFLLINFSDLPEIHAANAKDYFKPVSSSEKNYHFMNQGSWNDGVFTDVTTMEFKGYNKSTNKDKYTFRYYTVQNGPSGSYCYQSVPLGVYVDGKKVATFSSYLNVHVHNQTKLLGSVNIEVSEGIHEITLKDEKPGATVVVNSKYTVNMIPPSYTVTFKDWNGTTLKTQSVKYGRSATAPSNPSRTGYTFTGWDKDYSSITTNTTVNAKYSINSYTNTIGHWMSGFRNGEGNNDGGTAFNIANTTFTGTYGSTYTMNSSRATRIPNGFYLASSFGSSSISGSWNVYNLGTNFVQKPYGMWFEYDYVPYTYNISYNLDGGTNSGSNPSSYTVLYGVTLQNPTRYGYTFTGWYDSSGNKVTGINQGKNASFSSPTDMYNQLASRKTGNISLTARWQKNKYTVTTNHWMEKDTTQGAWNPSGDINGAGNMIRYPYPTSATVEHGNTYTPKPVSITGYELTSNSFAYHSPSLNAWTSSTTGTPIQIIQNMNFEFYYRKKTYTVSFNSNGGSKVENQSIKYKNKATSKTPTKENFKFIGWYTDSDLTNKFDFNTQITGDVTVYAKWERTHYDITYRHVTDDKVNGTKIFKTEVKKVPVNTNIPLANVSSSEIPLGYEPENKYRLYLNDKLVTTRNLAYSTKVDDTFNIVEIRYKSTLPTITGKETYYFVGDNVTSDMLARRGTASDVKDGNISNDIRVHSISYRNPSRLVFYPDSLETDKVQDVKVTLEVENSRGAVSTTDITVHVVKKGSDLIDDNEQASIYSRYISNETLVNGVNALNTLSSNSIWKTSDYASTLNNSLSNTIPLLQYNYVNDSTIEDYCKNANTGQSSNVDLVNRFK